MKKRGSFINSSKAFSLVELLVVVSIFLILTGVILFNQNRFSSNSAIQNLAYQIALTIREAQVYGISVRSSDDLSGSFDTAFGIHFDCSDKTHFILYADANKNGIYDPSPQGPDNERSTFTLESGNKINDISVNNNSFSCKSGSGSLLYKADITFRRPHPEAIITKNGEYGESSPTLDDIKIDVISALKDLHQCIIVTNTGQIYVDSRECYVSQIS